MRFGISIHALLAESDQESAGTAPGHTRFLSTLSLRRATRQSHQSPCHPNHFYPRSPCGERLTTGHFNLADLKFLSTLSLRRATINSTLAPASSKFLSTLSLRRATLSVMYHNVRLLYFYPRSPCGERPRLLPAKPYCKYFYPRSPCGERQP